MVDKPDSSMNRRSGWSVLPPTPEAPPELSAPTDLPAPAAQPAPLIRLDPDVTFTPIEIAGVSLARCVHAGTGVHFQFGAAEYHVAMLLDGKRSASEIVQQITADGLDWTPHDVADFLGVLISQKIATTQALPASPSAPEKKEAAPFFNPALLTTITKTCGYAISLRFPLVQGNPWAARVTPIIRPLLGGVTMTIACTGVLVSMLFATLHHGRLTGEVMRVFDSNQWLVMLVAWAVLKVIHELGHACMAHHHSVRVGRAGITFFMFAPLAYVDVTDAWKLPHRRCRVKIALGGVYLELICASIAVWIWWLLPGGVIAHVAAQVFFIAGPATLLVNANPLLRLDGYYVLSDLTNIPNLREQGRKIVGSAIERTVLHIESPASHLSGWRRSFAALHAAASLIFQFVWMSGLVIVISMWAGPIGLLIAACAILLWCILPAVRWLTRVWTYQSEEEMFSRGSHQRRIAWTGLTILMIGQFLITLPSPLSVEVPVVARFSSDQILRAPASGFVRHVYLDSGQEVRTGEVILEIENEELKVNRDEIALQLEVEKIQWQLHEQQNALGLAEASQQRRESMKRKLAELDDQVASMRVKAGQDGEILTSRLARLANEYVNHGDEVVQIGNRIHKELLISIGEDEMDAYRRAIENRETMRVCFRSGQWVDIELQPIRPRGSRQVSHPALAATAGGPIPVTPKHDGQDNGPSVQWLTPRFEAIVPLPPSQADLVHCGEVGMLALQDQRSLARRFWQWLKNDNAR